MAMYNRAVEIEMKDVVHSAADQLESEIRWWSAIQVLDTQLEIVRVICTECCRCCYWCYC